MKHIRSSLGAALAGAVASLSVAACSGAAPAAAPVVASTSIPAAAVAAPAVAMTTAKPPARTTSKPKPITKKATRSAATDVDTTRCTNRIDYSEDPRDNATINSIGEQTGKCPKPRKSAHVVGSGYDPSDRSYQGADDPGTSAGRGKTSGESQYEWGCQQGYITDGC